MEQSSTRRTEVTPTASPVARQRLGSTLVSMAGRSAGWIKSHFHVDELSAMALALPAGGIVSMCIAERFNNIPAATVVLAGTLTFGAGLALARKAWIREQIRKERMQIWEY
ncbi:MAG: hypothetical protein PHS44_04195 [Candidatus Dojkabacteria bacterium]|nr:hypothetical protein [Candidatus Dojkabacteria bacterium]